LNYVDWYNNRRLHSRLDNHTPEEHEQRYYAQPAVPPPGAGQQEDGMKTGTLQSSLPLLPAGKTLGLRAEAERLLAADRDGPTGRAAPPRPVA
jgi:hypothetical protein